ncbi:hypothetical protein MAPG_07008 [Magnaporthiopsis poae ATCC 64411]|uniref:RanBP2-type domain-containing protein n=1 Tax=Magnaporthiopsis poae (strain ATCC 64411 / 73-15) TaxID=644358 RepID=A0A0C4E3K5_MAGP6|nr:hypothetical protein MAPG_07008 [Magnaporthiopsis poae ATCC 64411]
MEAPKRITRSRAKAGSEKPATKIITAAAAAKKTAPAAPISRKRLRSDDADHDEDDNDELGGAEPAQSATKLRTAARAARGRPRKAEAVEETKCAEPAPAPKPRGRPAKKIAPAKEEPLAAAPVRATRTTRAKKTEPPPQSEETAEPLKPATRARATTAATAAKATVKKSVKFEEPEKENTPPIVPKTKRVKAVAAEPPAPVAAEPVTTGLRARPLRRAAAAAAPSAPARATRGGAKSTAAAAAQKEERPATPLGPKRITQLTRAKNADRGDESDDELAGDDTTSQRPLMKSPVRPAPAVRPELELPSPARRGVGAPLLALPEGGNIAGQDIKSPLKPSLLFSPAKRPKSPMKTMQAAAPSLGDVSRSPMKASLLNSPAKRLFSPAKPKHRDEAKKVEENDQEEKENEEEQKENEEEQQSAEMEFGSPATEPVLLTAPVGLDAEYLPAAARQAQMVESPTRQLFPGRLSAVLPRHADPALKDTVMGVVARVNAEQAASQEEEEAKQKQVCEEAGSVAGEAMDVDEPTVQVASEENASPRPGFGLRQKDLDPYAGVDSESDDDLGTPAATASRQARAIQTPSRSTRQAGRGLSLGVQSSSKSVIKKMSESSGLGFTPLAEKLNGWKASSPLKVGIQQGSPALISAVAIGAREEAFIGAEQVSAATTQDSPAKSTFFDDEMLVRADFQIEESAVIAQDEVEQQLEMEVDEPELGDLPITQEDVELAAEAHEMSLLDQSRLEEKLCAETGMDDSISDASQEYGDENQTPIDPALMVQDQQLNGSASPGVPPVTPQRFVTRTFHTVSKIPLKPADESTPRSALAEAKQSRRHSVAKLPGATTPTKSRPSNGLARNATVISYSPTKADRQAEEAGHGVEEEPQTTSAPVTPVRSESGFSWSTTGTPARTPRRDVNPALLRGAVVFVDVRTSEGADSSEIFVELLSQMGAVCLRSWDWTPDEADSVSKVGITHVVFKDGSNQTIQKVRECGGVVQCVGVSWVLDCERENEWLEEAPYSIDTSLTPRGGGGRRRKTMDPNAFSNSSGGGNSRRRDRRGGRAALLEEAAAAESWEDDQWTCDICTLLNPANYLCCDACGTERSEKIDRDLSARTAKRRRTDHDRGQEVVDLTQDSPPRANRASASTSTASSRTVSGSGSVPGPRPATWDCSFCGTRMEHKWWTCSTCGKMKDSS